MLQKLMDKSFKALEYDRILEMLSRECTSPDSAKMAMSLRPCPDIGEAQTELGQTEDACRLSLRFGGPSFFGLMNIASALNRAEIGSSLMMKELLDVARVLSVIRSLARYREMSASESTGLDELFDSLSPNKYLEDKITSSIVSEEEVADDASHELSDIRRHMKRCGVRVREQLDKLVRSSSYQKYLQESIVTIRGGRFVVPVKS
ncbi:MAG TPA: endonuclease MutS2, partial [Clostridia bacterium]|nr:endonuclease MutS2 [Clostridia bacterium]